MTYDKREEPDFYGFEAEQDTQRSFLKEKR